jgi:hypothetical protein
MSGISKPGKPGIVGCAVAVGPDVISGPGSVVIATVPSVVREHPAARPTRISAAAPTRTCVFIWATIGASAT